MSDTPEEKAPEPTAAEVVEKWLDDVMESPIPHDEIKTVLHQASESDRYAKMVYQIMGWLIGDLTVSHNLCVTPANFDQILFRAGREFDMPCIETPSDEAIKESERPKLVLPPGVRMQ